jgi:hypothetical protein
VLIGSGDGVGNLGSASSIIDAEIARAHGPVAAQLVDICGRDDELAAKLAAHNWRLPVNVQGRVNNTSDRMAACDIFCTKAGPCSVAECFVRGMPILLSGDLPGQEANVKYIVEDAAGEYLCRPSKLGAIAARWVANTDALNYMRSTIIDSKSVRADVAHLCSKRVNLFAVVQDLRVLGDLRVRGLECLGEGLIATVRCDQRVLAAGIKIMTSAPVKAVVVASPSASLASPASPRPPRDENGEKESQMPRSNTTQLSAGIPLENSVLQR